MSAGAPSDRDGSQPEADLVLCLEEIAETGAIPVIVGGDHSLMYPDVVAITDVYGKGSVGVIHFDAHFDGIPRLVRPLDVARRAG